MDLDSLKTAHHPLELLRGLLYWAPLAVHILLAFGLVLVRERALKTLARRRLDHRYFERGPICSPLSVTIRKTLLLLVFEVLACIIHWQRVRLVLRGLIV